MESTKWHTLPAEEAMKQLSVGEQGLSSKEAEERLEKYGKNEIAEKKKSSSLILFLGQFESLLIVVLIAAALISFVFGELMDAAVILIIIVINAALGFYQEKKAENALEQLRKMTVTRTIAIRDGRRMETDSKTLVPGDTILLREGDKVPADCRIVESSRVKMDESLLTGESVPVTKKTEALRDVAVADRTNMAFCGTSVVYGNCRAVVAKTGMQTEFGKLAAKLQESEEPTPLQRRLAVLGRQLTAIILAIAAVVFISGSIRGIGMLEMFKVAVSIAVAAIPEGLPAIVTITLAVGLVRMSKRKAIVRRLPATESLGSVTVICTDKTGTLTKNEMAVRKLYAEEKIIDYESYSGEDKTVEALLLTGLLCSDADEKTGDPTEIALVKAAKKYGLEDMRQTEKRLDEIPFDSDRRMMSVVYKTSGKNMFTKGAVEDVMKKCTRIYRKGLVANITEKDRKNILKANYEMTSQALRVLAFAYKPLKEKTAEEDLIFIGLQGMIDPPRPEVKEAIEKCKSAGIKVVMITGDHQNTADAIARELGITGRSVTGAELERMKDKEFESLVNDIAVYSRTSPEQKTRITETLRKKGHIVAMSGDGVNDAPALKKADVGIAVGSGTDVTKEAADIVLTDDNFATIVAAVEEGRGIYDNIKKFVTYMLSANFSEILVVFTALLISMPLPLLPLQILWINLLTDGLPALAIGVEANEKDIMKRKPRNPREKILSRENFSVILFVGAVLAAETLFLFSLHLPDEAKARTMAFTTLVVGELFAAANFRSYGTINKIGFLSNRKFLAAVSASLILQIAVIYIPLMNAAFQTVPLGLAEWSAVLGAGALLFALVELMKAAKERLCTKTRLSACVSR